MTSQHQPYADTSLDELEKEMETHGFLMLYGNYRLNELLVEAVQRGDWETVTRIEQLCRRHRGEHGWSTAAISTVHQGAKAAIKAAQAKTNESSAEQQTPEPELSGAEWQAAEAIAAQDTALQGAVLMSILGYPEKVMTIPELATQLRKPPGAIWRILKILEDKGWARRTLRGDRWYIPQSTAQSE